MPTERGGRPLGLKLTPDQLRARVRKQFGPSEHLEQVAVVIHCRCSRDEAKQRVVATPNAHGMAGGGGVRAGVRRKAEGVQAGFPDLTWHAPRRGFAGLAIELKRERGGVTSPQQLEWLAWLAGCGWHTAICHGRVEAIRLVDWYFGSHIGGLMPGSAVEL